MTLPETTKITTVTAIMSGVNELIRATIESYCKSDVEVAYSDTFDYSDAIKSYRTARKLTDTSQVDSVFPLLVWNRSPLTRWNNDQRRRKSMIIEDGFSAYWSYGQLEYNFCIFFKNMHELELFEVAYNTLDEFDNLQILIKILNLTDHDFKYNVNWDPMSLDLKFINIDETRTYVSLSGKASITGTFLVASTELPVVITEICADIYSTTLDYDQTLIDKIQIVATTDEES